MMPSMKKSAMPSVAVTKPIPQTTVKSENGFKGADLVKFMAKHGQSEKSLAIIIGVDHRAIRYWATDQRPLSTTNVRLIKLFDKYPTLMKEFAP